MKIKKILAGVAAGAMALSTFASMSLFTASADPVSSKVIWEKAAGQDLSAFTKKELEIKATDDGVGKFEYWSNDTQVKITYEKVNKKKEDNKYYAKAQLAVKGLDPEDPTEGWKWTNLYGSINANDPDGNVANGAENTFTFSLAGKAEGDDYDPDAENPEETKTNFNNIDLFKSAKALVFKGQNMRLKKVEIVGTYNPPVQNKWINNGDGSYTLNYTTPEGAPAKELADFKMDVNNFPISKVVPNADVKSISFDVTGDNIYTLNVGANDKNGDYQEWKAIAGNDSEGFKKTDYTKDTKTLTFNIDGLKDGDEPLIQLTWLNANTSITFSNFRVNGKSVTPHSFEAKAGEGGTITSDKEAGKYVEGETIHLTATPNQGYEFASWTEATTGTVSENAEFDYIMGDKNVVLTANFRKPDTKWSFETAVIGGGDITASVEDGTYQDATSIDLTATPKEGYKFVNWTDADGKVISTDANFTYVLKEDIKLVAHFDEIKYPFSVTATQGGKASFAEAGKNRTDISALDKEKWAVENKEKRVKRLIRGGEADGSVWTDHSGDDKLVNAKSITLTITGVNDSRLATTGGIIYSLSESDDKNWVSGVWKINVGGENDEGVEVTRLGTSNYYNVTFTPTEQMFTKEELEAVKADGNFYPIAIAIENYGNSDDKSTPDMVIKGIALNDADGKAIWTEGKVYTEADAPAAGEESTGLTSGEYPAGTTLDIFATAEEGYKFVNWTDANGNVVSTKANDTYTIKAPESTDKNTDGTITEEEPGVTKPTEPVGITLTANFVKDDSSSSKGDTGSSSADSNTSSNNSNDSKGDTSSITEITTSKTDNSGNSPSANSGKNSSGNNDASPNTGAAAALVLSGMALAGAAVIISKRKK